MKVRASLVVISIIGVLAGCARPGDGGHDRPGNASGPSPATTAAGGTYLVEPGYAGRFRVRATVLEASVGSMITPRHGPQLCDAVALSNPPQCSGPDVVGWDWSLVPAESRDGTTWGLYLLTGTWDAAQMRFTVTERPVSGDEARQPSLRDPRRGLDLTTPCPTPPDGWRPTDPARATEAATQAAVAIAEAEPDYAGSWLDQSYLDQLDPATVMGQENDPKRYVLNVAFTGDLERHERQIRSAWGGALCLSKVARPQAELERIRSEVARSIDDELSASIVGGLANHVALMVTVAWADEQRELDAKYGTGTVVLVGWLEPID